MEFTTPTKVAKQLGTSSETIRTLCRRGELPAYRIGGHFRIPKQEYEQWLEARRIGPTEAPRIEPTSQNRSLIAPLRFNNLPGFEL